MRSTSALVAVVGMAVSAALLARNGEASGGSAVPVVPCDEIILDTKFPYPTGGYRTVLGVIAVPPAYLKQVVPTRSKPWAYWRKAGLVVRAGSPQVTVTVPRDWRTRASIAWGNGSAGSHAVSLAIASCAGPVNAGHAYAGGFYLRSASACVPLIFQVGAQHATVLFGLGKRCQSR